MQLQIGLFLYLLVKTCALPSFGATAYPMEDTADKNRIIYMCTDYGTDQTFEVFIHEVTHACLHNHQHSYKTKQELDDHVKTVQQQPEEAMVGSLAACLVPVLEDESVATFLGLIKNDSKGSSGRQEEASPSKEGTTGCSERHCT